MSAGSSVVLTPKADNRLVWREVVHALENRGYTIAAREEKHLTPHALTKMYALPPDRSNIPEHPKLFLSINFHGLDKHGEIFSILQDKGVPVAVWCVDNVWNLLSSLRSDFWKKLSLFVTDASFIPDLKAHGAKYVEHLPLAVDATVFSPSGKNARSSTTQHPVVFVGRSAFPDKKRFFVGQTIPEDLRQTAIHTLKDGTRPDFFWWLNALGAQNTPLWPGSLVRRAALGAEEMSLAWKTACLQAAMPLGLTIFGDNGWQTSFPHYSNNTPELLPPVDYYVGLRQIYENAPFSLNMVSFLLPHGLNQRHFDIWAAGGFCLMDNSPGLNCFPKALTEPVIFKTPDDIPAKISYFDKNQQDKEYLSTSWKKHILTEHTYNIRIDRLVKTIFS